MGLVQIDHFVLGISDLNKGIAEFEERTGVKPTIGGVHEGAGTHNALVSLGNGIYLEILAPRSNDKATPTAFGTFDFDTLTPIGWVLGTSDSPEVLRRMQEHGLPNSGIRPLSRKMDNGKALKWTNIFHLSTGAVSLNPFFIDWEAGATHPSELRPKGCTLKNFTINDTTEDALMRFLKDLPIKLQFDTIVDQVNAHILQLGLDTPKGYISF